MNTLYKKTRKFFTELHEDETGPGTVEWILIVVVALILMAVIYFIAQWVMDSGAEASKKVSDEKSVAKSLRDAFKSANLK